MSYYRLITSVLLCAVLLTSLAVAGAQKGKQTRVERIDALDQGGEVGVKAGKGRTIASAPELQPTMPEGPLSTMAPLSGTYSVGAAGTFPSINAAVAALNANGVSGAVTMRLDDASYNSSPVVLGAITGASAVNTITFRPKAGTAVTVEINGAYANGKGISFSGAKWIIWDGINTGGASLTVKWNSVSEFPYGDALGATFYLAGTAGGTSNNTLKNMTIEGRTDAAVYDDATDFRGAIFVDNTTAGVTSLTIEANTIINASFAIYSFNAAGGTEPTGLTIKNNSIGSAFGEAVGEGIGINRVNSGLIQGNTLNGLRYNEIIYASYSGPANVSGYYFVYPLVVASADGGTVIEKNTIYDVFIGNGDNEDPDLSGFVTYALRSTGRSTSSRPTVKNNTSSTFNSDDEAITYWGTRGQNTILLHNSFYFTGTTGGVGMAGMLIDVAPSNNTIHNNIFYSDISDGNVPYFVQSGAGPLGTRNNNLIDAVGFDIVTYKAGASGADAQSVNGNPRFLSTSALTINTALFSAADQIGGSGFITTDKAGAARDTSAAGKRDAGAYEFTLSTPFLEDGQPTSISAPNAAGATQGLPSAVKVTVVNTRPTPLTFTVNVTIAGGTPYTNTSSSITLAAFDDTLVTLPNWTPTTNDLHTITATVSGDDESANNVLSRDQPVTPVIAFGAGYSTDFDGVGDDFGWFGTSDWVLDGTFTKLTGPHTGAGKSWVTKITGGYTTGGVTFSVLSPYFDFTSVAVPTYVSFFHSLETEPGWDRSQLQYSIDTGATWVQIGTVNDPNGVNWLNTSLYQNAVVFPGGAGTTSYCIDSTNIAPSGFNFGPAFTQNGECNTLPVGNGVFPSPEGWVFVATKLPAVLNGKPMVRFRYIAFSDASTSYDGWAFDDFALGTSLPSFGGSVSGTAFTDVNGNGIDDAEAAVVGSKIYLSYFGVLKDSFTTTGAGAYTFSSLLPGSYTLEIPAPKAYTTPFQGIGEYDNSGSDVVTGLDFGQYAGSISGNLFEDLNNNGALNGLEVGAAGWTIEVHSDSLTGDVYASGTTNGLGNYLIWTPPGIYVTAAVQQTNTRKTLPTAAGYTDTISGTSGAGTATKTGRNFGEYLFGQLRVSLFVDANGNGLRNGADVVALPSGSTANYTVQKNGVTIPGGAFTLGGGINSTVFTVDTGNYTVTQTTLTAGWKSTLGGVIVKTNTTSSQKDTAYYLAFQLVTVSGQKFNDLDGDGIKDGGEPGLSGWTISIDGTNYGATSAITDGSGNYSIDSVGGSTQIGNGYDNHNVTETGPAGWAVTTPVGGIQLVEGKSQNLQPGATSGRDFGNFDKSDIGGVVYRDYNGNGTMDGGDVAMSGVTITLVEKALSDVSDGSGYSFNGVLTTDSVAITIPGGFVVTEPAAGGYRAALQSGGAVVMNFGLFQTTDSSTRYRTFTAAQLGADDQKKPGKAPKAGKAYDPVKNKPSTANLVDYLINPKTGIAPGGVVVGVPGHMNLGGKEKAYVKPNKQGALWASLNKKGVHHTGMARGFDLDIKGKPILKLQKSFDPGKKQDNQLFAELLALKLNLLSSGATTPAGLGSLIYSDAGSDFDGWTIDEISDYADTLMTDFEFMPLGLYTALDSIAGKINGAFYNSATDDTASDGGWASLPLTWSAYTSVNEVSFLKPNPGTAPKNRRELAVPEAVPSAFALMQNYPNPFNPSTTIEFELPEASIVTLKVYNLLGQEVATLLNKEEIEFGDAVEFNASALPSGVYLYRMVAETIADEDAGVAAETFTKVQKMVLVK